MVMNYSTNQCTQYIYTIYQHFIYIIYINIVVVISLSLSLTYTSQIPAAYFDAHCSLLSLSLPLSASIIFNLRSIFNVDVCVLCHKSHSKLTAYSLQLNCSGCTEFNRYHSGVQWSYRWQRHDHRWSRITVAHLARPRCTWRRNPSHVNRN